MATRFLDKAHGANSTTAIANDTTGKRIVQDLPDAVGIVYDKVDNTVKINAEGTILPILTGASIAGGVKVVGGSTALDGSNPTDIATGLTTVIGFAALPVTADATSGTAFLGIGTISAGTVPVNAFQDDGTASTGTETIYWVAIGT